MDTHTVFFETGGTLHMPNIKVTHHALQVIILQNIIITHAYSTNILYQNLSSHYGLHQTCTKLCHWWARTIDKLEQFTCCYLHLIFTLGLFYTFTSWHINAFTFDQWSVSVERIVSTPVWPFPCKLEFLPKHQNKLQSIASIASPIVKVTNKAKAISYNAKGYNSRPKYSL